MRYCGHRLEQIAVQSAHAPDLDPFAYIGSGRDIVETRDLPGFVEDGVTYKSHHFWVHFVGTRDVLIRVHHGGGWQLWRGDSMLAKALRRYGSDDRGLFLLAWFLIDSARNAKADGYEDAKEEYTAAFVDGRIRRRTYPARGITKVWIEPKSSEQSAAVAKVHALSVHRV